MTKEFNIIGGIASIMLVLCYLLLIGSATAISFTEYEKKDIEPIVLGNESYFSIYNDDRLSYQIYIYNHTGNESFHDGIIGRMEPSQSIYLPKNASYYLYAEYQDITILESEEGVKKLVNEYWLIAIVGVIIIVGLYTALRIIRRRT
jgi:hypothetical protein